MRLSKHLGDPSVWRVTLAVELSGSAIYVRAGDFCAEGTESTLEEQEYVVPLDYEDAHEITGYLCRDTASGEAFVLIDDIRGDGYEDPYSPHPSDPFRALMPLFRLDVPAGTVPSDSLLTVHHIVAER